MFHTQMRMAAAIRISLLTRGSTFCDMNLYYNLEEKTEEPEFR